jgi:eukaryotic-like serine/threonine-protein kinase
MEPDRRRHQISDLYHAALDRRPAEREAFLKEACDGDEALRQEVESLLQYESQSAGFLETPAAVVAGAMPGATRSAGMIGHAIGPYTIVAPLGAGGMGEVYRARDSKLGRDVAIKILPSHFTANPERRARFAREARTLATLNHPHIGAIYGLEEADGVTGIVLELVEGPTLADRLERGPLKIGEALVVARQTAEALGAAHEKGIVHRDLKPANIVLQRAANAAGVPSGDTRTKVLDFGLAKTLAAGPDQDLTQLPPDSLDRTADGRILGTPAYMSPEQARGQAVDKRTDIWAFGCVLFEMLTGHRAFDGNTMSDTIVSVLEREPRWDVLPSDTPGVIRTLLRRCLRKDPGRRVHDIADAILEIDDAAAMPPVPSGEEAIAGSGRVRSIRSALPWLAAGALAVALAWVGLLYQRAVGALQTEPTQLTIHPPDGVGTSFFALSPDGRYLAFTPQLASRPMLWVHSLVTGETRALPSTEGARAPFWKPDSQEIAYFAGDQLKTVALRGGSPVFVATVDPSVAGGAWGRSNVIIVPKTQGQDGLLKVSATGGPLEAVTVLGNGELLHRAPEFLPDGVHFLYLARLAGTQSLELRVGSLESKERVESLGPVESHAVFAGGYLFFVRGGHIGGGSLTVQAFDPDRRRLIGDAMPLGLPAAVTPPLPFGAFSVSAESDRLVYLPRTANLYDLIWHNRSGEKVGTVGDTGVYRHLDISPDDERVAVSRQTQAPGKPLQLDIWTIDLKPGGGARRVTDDPAYEADPAWSGDGRQLAFNSNPLIKGGRAGLFVRLSDGTGQDVRFAEPAVGPIASPDWSLDTKHIVYTDGGDLWTVPTAGDRKPSVFLKTKNAEKEPVFSPDGRWVAYSSDSSGRDEVYIRPFPPGDTVHQVSRGGGWAPRWRRDGKELFFLSLDSTVMAVSIDPATGKTLGVPRGLFPTGLRHGYQYRPYDVTRDGQRFLVPTMRPGDDFRVVLNWRTLLPR